MRKPQPPIKDRLAAARQKDYVSVAELALLVGVSERTIWRQMGHLESVRVGRAIRVDRRHAMRLFREQQVAREV